MKTTLSGTFDDYGYLVLRGLLSKETVSDVFDYVMDRSAGGSLAKNDRQVPDTPVAYGDSVTELLLEAFSKPLGKMLGETLLPTYSFYRLYKRGDVLRRHRDRDACEVSVSVNLGQLPDEPWPFWVAGFKGETALSLMPGDGILYKGIQCDHWREAYAGEHLGQAFLHYVRANGPYRSWEFDKRTSLNLPGAKQYGTESS